MNKAELRAAQRQRLRALSPDSCARHAALLCERLQRDPRVAAAARIGIYLALPDEPDLSPFLHAALREGKLLALPFPHQDGSWKFHRIQSLSAPRNGRWNLRQPPAGEILPAALLDVILVPGLAFSPEGTRLGRGKGIYDRLLAAARGLTIGCGFPAHLVDFVPAEAFDVRLKEVWAGKD